jgi:lipopolysaccharide transport system permease protein
MALLHSLWRHRHLLATLVRRDLAARFRGSLLGALWTVLQPLLLLTVYGVVFGMVYHARWGSPDSPETAPFALVLFSGLAVFQLVADVLGRAPMAVLSQPSFVTKVVFPLEILPVVPVCSALIQAAINFALLLAALAATAGLPATALWLPLVLAPVAVLLLGLSWFLAALGVYVRDVAHVMNMVLTAALFLSPVFYPLSRLPRTFQQVLLFNPLTIPVEATRAALIGATAPDPAMLGAFALVSLGVCAAGFAWFQKTRKGFADVL